MKEFNQLPKTVKKTIRYILQDASEDKLIMIKNRIDNAISKREKKFDQTTNEEHGEWKKKVSS